MRGGDVKPIKALLARYTQLQAPEGAVLTVVAAAIETATGIKLKKSELRYNTHTRVVGLQFAGPKKQEVIMKKAKILALAKDALGAKSAPQAIV